MLFKSGIGTAGRREPVVSGLLTGTKRAGVVILYKMACDWLMIKMNCNVLKWLCVIS